MKKDNKNALILSFYFHLQQCVEQNACGDETNALILHQLKHIALRKCYFIFRMQSSARSKCKRSSVNCAIYLELIKSEAKKKNKRQTNWNLNVFHSVRVVYFFFLRFQCETKQLLRLCVCFNMIWWKRQVLQCHRHFIAIWLVLMK